MHEFLTTCAGPLDQTPGRLIAVLDPDVPAIYTLTDGAPQPPTPTAD
ncbi:hypothetical protein ACIGHB_30310 [Streptomyces sp. NPDC085460]